MRTIFILMDSLNRHMLPAYGNDWVKTPNIDRLASRGLVFDKHYCGSMPCMPARRDMMTGRINFLETFLDLYRAGDQNIGFASSFDLRRAWYHPQNKIPAGERVARWALATQYGFQGRVHWKPPMVTKVEGKEGKILVHVDNEVAAADPAAAIVGFAIAGADGKFHPATAACLVVGKDGRGRPQHDRTVVVLTSPHVPHPVHYRYAWGRNPMGNLQIAHTNQKDIPFATQRSDSWTMADMYAAYLDKPVADPAAGLNRAESEALKTALQQADRERRLRDAKALIEEDQEKQ